MTVDVHTHIIPRDWEDWGRRHGGNRWPRLVHEAPGCATLYQGGAFFRTLTDAAFDPGRRLADMDRLGIDRQLLSPPPVMFCYWADARATAEFARMQNDAIAEVVGRSPDRFFGAGTLPMQDPDLAVKEMERCSVALGFRCVEIGSNVEGRDLDAPAFSPVFEAAAGLDVAFFVHPGMTLLGRERLQKHYFPLIVGNPLETAVAIASLVYGGVLERWPGLRFCFAHGGGAFPFILGRIDHGWRVRPEGPAAIPRPPNEYARLLYFDSLTHSPSALGFLVSTFGPERVLLGSDYPFDMGSEDPLADLGQANLPEATRRRVEGGNAVAFLGIR